MGDRFQVAFAKDSFLNIRVRLRTLVLVITMICGILASFAAWWHQAERQREAVQFLENLDFEIIYHHEYVVDGDWQRPAGRKYPNSQWLSQLLGKDFFGQIDYVLISGYSDREAIDDEALRHICDITSLQEIDLKGVKTSRMNLLRLHELKRLSSLVLDFTDIDDGQVTALDGLDHLQALTLTGTQITDKSLPLLAQLEGLVTLDISYTEVSDKGLQSLEGCQNLELLRIWGTKASPEGIERLQQALPQCDIQAQDPWAEHQTP